MPEVVNYAATIAGIGSAIKAHGEELAQRPSAVAAVGAHLANRVGEQTKGMGGFFKQAMTGNPHQPTMGLVVNRHPVPLPAVEPTSQHREAEPLEMVDVHPPHETSEAMQPSPQTRSNPWQRDEPANPITFDPVALPHEMREAATKFKPAVANQGDPGKMFEPVANALRQFSGGTMQVVGHGISGQSYRVKNHGRFIDVMPFSSLGLADVGFGFDRTAGNPYKAGKELGKGSLEFIRSFNNVVKEIAKTGLNIGYSADADHAKLYDKALPKLGYEKLFQTEEGRDIRSGNHMNHYIWSLKGQPRAEGVTYGGREWAIHYMSVRARIERAAQETDWDPTDEQKKAGNYKKGRFGLHGLEFTLETPKGAYRRGVSANGEQWAIKMPCHYGYLNRTVGKDDDQIDCMIGPWPHSEIVFVVDQEKPSRRFDEHKCVLACHSERQARELYLACYSPGWKGLGAITPMLMEDFKRWVFRGDTGKRAALQTQYHATAEKVDYGILQGLGSNLKSAAKSVGREFGGAAKALAGGLAPAKHAELQSLNPAEEAMTQAYDEFAPGVKAAGKAIGRGAAAVGRGVGNLLNNNPLPNGKPPLAIPVQQPPKGKNYPPLAQPMNGPAPMGGATNKGNVYPTSAPAQLPGSVNAAQPAQPSMLSKGLSAVGRGMADASELVGKKVLQGAQKIAPAIGNTIQPRPQPAAQTPSVNGTPAPTQQAKSGGVPPVRQPLPTAKVMPENPPPGWKDTYAESVKPKGSPAVALREMVHGKPGQSVDDYKQQMADEGYSPDQIHAAMLSLSKNKRFQHKEGKLSPAEIQWGENAEKGENVSNPLEKERVGPNGPRVEPAQPTVPKTFKSAADEMKERLVSEDPAEVFADVAKKWGKAEAIEALAKAGNIGGKKKAGTPGVALPAGVTSGPQAPLPQSDREARGDFAASPTEKPANNAESRASGPNGPIEPPAHPSIGGETSPEQPKLVTEADRNREESARRIEAGRQAAQARQEEIGHWEKEAESNYIPKDQLHAAASAIAKEDKERAQDHNAMLARARQLLIANGAHINTLMSAVRRGSDWASVPGFDNVAKSLAAADSPFRGYFDEHKAKGENETDTLAQLLIDGDLPLKDTGEVYGEAFQRLHDAMRSHFASQTGEPKKEEEHAIPFQRDEFAMLYGLDMPAMPAGPVPSASAPPAIKAPEILRPAPGSPFHIHGPAFKNWFGDWVWIAFHPHQIKSATENQGTFNPSNPDIRYEAEQVHYADLPGRKGPAEPGHAGSFDKAGQGVAFPSAEKAAVPQVPQAPAPQPPQLAERSLSPVAAAKAAIQPHVPIEQQQTTPSPKAGEMAKHLESKPSGDEVAALLHSGQFPWHTVGPEDHVAMVNHLKELPAPDFWRVAQLASHGLHAIGDQPHSQAARQIIHDAARKMPDAPEVELTDANKDMAVQVNPFVAGDTRKAARAMALLSKLPAVKGDPLAVFLPKGFDVQKFLGPDMPVEVGPVQTSGGESGNSIDLASDKDAEPLAFDGPKAAPQVSEPAQRLLAAFRENPGKGMGMMHAALLAKMQPGEAERAIRELQEAKLVEGKFGKAGHEWHAVGADSGQLTLPEQQIRLGIGGRVPAKEVPPGFREAFKEIAQRPGFGDEAPQAQKEIAAHELAKLGFSTEVIQQNLGIDAPDVDKALQGIRNMGDWTPEQEKASLAKRGYSDDEIGKAMKKNPAPPPAPFVWPSTPEEQRQVTKSLGSEKFAKVKNSGGGVTGSYTVTMADGHKGKWKPTDQEDPHGNLFLDGSTEIHGVPKGGFASREESFYNVAKILGADDLVPITIRRTEEGQGEGSMQHFITGAMEASKAPRYGVNEWGDSHTDVARATAMDYLMGHIDRHYGNWMLRELDDAYGETGAARKLTLIDNGLSMPEDYMSEHAYTNCTFMRRAFGHENIPIPDLSSWRGKWPEIASSMKKSGISEKAVGLAEERYNDLMRLETMRSNTIKNFFRKPPLFHHLNGPFARRIAKIGFQ